jgi:ElaB protein
MDISARPLPADRTENATHNLRQMVDQLDSALKSAADSGDAKFDAARDRLTMQVQAMRHQLDELNEAAVARMKRAARQADEAVHAHPYGAIGAAAAAGLVVGFLAARR